MQIGLEEKSLKDRTTVYWQGYDVTNPMPALTRYIHDLLPDEMAYADKKGRLPAKTCDELVLLVGHSIEPLLQTVWAYNPSKKVFLIVNHHYGVIDGTHWYGEDQANNVRELIEELKQIEAAQISPKLQVVHKVVSKSEPTAIFQVLIEKLGESSAPVIDITGAKKSMVSGAYLYAAFANVPVSYVDFEDDAYDIEFHKPYGFGCKIGLLDNPYKQFALRDWERVSHYYRDYKFQEALNTLQNPSEENMLEVTDKYISAAVSSVYKLISILACYAQWQAGDYEKALQEANRSEIFPLPESIPLLGANWVQTLKDSFVLPTGFYFDDAKVRAYAFDEVVRIERLIRINHDYRSAFLRSGGLNEILLKKRLVDEVTGADKHCIAKMVQIEHIITSTLFERLIEGKPYKLGKNKREILINPIRKWWLADESPVIQPNNMFNKPDGWRIFLNCRNKLTHTFATIPPEWAADALKFVQAHLLDIWQDTDFSNLNTGEMNWPEVVQFTGLNKYLPSNIQNEE